MSNKVYSIQKVVIINENGEARVSSIETYTTHKTESGARKMLKELADDFGYTMAGEDRTNIKDSKSYESFFRIVCVTLFD